MNAISRRRTNPVADVLSWLATEPPFTLRGLGLTPYVRVEDHFEDDTHLVRAEMG